MHKILFTAALLFGAAGTALAQGAIGPASSTMPPPQAKASSAAEPKAKKPKPTKAKAAGTGASSSMP